jgi:hypothetical protein
MNVNQAASDAFLHRAMIHQGVDRLLPTAHLSWVHLLESSSSSSSSSSASSSNSDSNDSSSSDDDSSSSCPSAHMRDDSSASSSSELSDDTMDRFMENYALTNDIAGAFSATIPTLIGVPSGAMALDFDEDEVGEHNPRRKERSANQFGYTLGDYMNCNYVRKFLGPEVRDITYQKSRNRKSGFRSSFRVPLSFVDHLTDMFITEGWVQQTQKCKTPQQLRTRTELFILCALEHLGNRRPHCQFEHETNMSATEHSKFFDLFTEKLFSVHQDYIFILNKCTWAKHHAQNWRRTAVQRGDKSCQRLRVVEALCIAV